MIQTGTNSRIPLHFNTNWQVSHQILTLNCQIAVSDNYMGLTLNHISSPDVFYSSHKWRQLPPPRGEPQNTTFSLVCCFMPQPLSEAGNLGLFHYFNKKSISRWYRPPWSSCYNLLRLRYYIFTWNNHLLSIYKYSVFVLSITQ